MVSPPPFFLQFREISGNIAAVARLTLPPADPAEGEKTAGR